MANIIAYLDRPFGLREFLDCGGGTRFRAPRRRGDRGHRLRKRRLFTHRSLLIREPPHQCPDAKLEDEFFPGIEALAAAGAAAFGGELQVVIKPAQNCMPEHDQKPGEHVELGDVGDEQDCAADGTDDEDAAHGGHVGLGAGVATENVGIGKA